MNVKQTFLWLFLGLCLLLALHGATATEEDLEADAHLDEDETSYEDMSEEEEIKLHKEEFDAMDTNGNGKLEKEELATAAKDEEIEESEIAEFVTELDTDKDGAVSWDEYVNGLFASGDEIEGMEELEGMENAPEEEEEEEQH